MTEPKPKTAKKKQPLPSAEGVALEYIKVAEDIRSSIYKHEAYMRRIGEKFAEMEAELKKHIDAQFMDLDRRIQLRMAGIKKDNSNALDEAFNRAADAEKVAAQKQAEEETKAKEEPEDPAELLRRHAKMRFAPSSKSAVM